MLDRGQFQIVVIEDEHQLNKFVVEMFEDYGYQCSGFVSAESFLESGLNSSDVHCLVVDRSLPKMNGIDLIKSLRASSWDSSIIVLTALGAPEQIVEGIRAGADDYLKKPFYAEELCARVDRFVERVSRNKVRPSSWKLLTNERLFTNGENNIRLTPTETKILEKLNEKLGHLVERTEFDSNKNPSRSIDVHVTALRKKLEPLGFQIENIRGKGYCLSQAS